MISGIILINIQDQMRMEIESLVTSYRHEFHEHICQCHNRRPV